MSDSATDAAPPMHVVATAGHVDHGKSSLVRALTGTDPDRLPEEHRRGLSIELGYAQLKLPDGFDVAFVDVPGHERFVSTMLAGVGPVPACLFVVAADDAWMPQAAEHLAALDALGVRHGVVAISRSDLADPKEMARRAREELGRTSLAGSPVIPVSAVTGSGLDALTGAIEMLVRRLDQPDPAADVRMWVDRCFQLPGAGTIVTGTLPAGTLRVGDRLTAGEGTVQVRGLQVFGRAVARVSGTARVAVRLGGRPPRSVGRGTPLLTPDAWQHSALVDVRVTGQDPLLLPSRPTAYLGSGSTGVRVRRLGADVVRLRLDHPLPLRVRDRLLLRDSGRRLYWAATVLDPLPPPLRRRGAAAERARRLQDAGHWPDLADELRRRTTVRRSVLQRLGVPLESAGEVAVEAGDWLLDREQVPRLRQALLTAVGEHDAAEPLDPGLPVGAAAHRLGLPERDLVPFLMADPLVVRQGRVCCGPPAGVPVAVAAAVEAITGDLAARPFQAPDRGRLTEVGLDAKALGVAARAGLVLRLAGDVVLLPGSDQRACEVLAGLPQPFTVSQARVALDTSRRVVVPLLEHLDRRSWTNRYPDDTRSVASPQRRPG